MKKPVYKIEKWTCYYGNETPFVYYIKRNLKTGKGKSIKSTKGGTK